MTYAVKEIFFTLQGEGAQAGRAAVFLRFAGCNLWSGREADRAGAVCTFCDTDFVGTNGVNGGKFESAKELAEAVAANWPVDTGSGSRPLVVVTGGEPLLQLDTPLIDALHESDFDIAVETNGTIAAPPGIDWLTVSPKGHSDLVQTSGNELKLVFPQGCVDPADFEALDFRHFFLQPMDVSDDRSAADSGTHENIAATLDYIRRRPRWRLSLQAHKLIGIP